MRGRSNEKVTRQRAATGSPVNIADIEAADLEIKLIDVLLREGERRPELIAAFISRVPCGASTKKIE